MNQTVVVDGEMTLKSSLDGEINLSSLIDGDPQVMIPADSMAYESGTYTPTNNVYGFSKLFKFPHEKAPFCVLVSDKSANANVTNNVLTLSIIEYKNLFNVTMQSNDPETVYTAVLSQAYRDASATYPKTFSMLYRENRGFITNEGFTVLTEVDGTFWLKDHTYEWVAVWKA